MSWLRYGCPFTRVGAAAIATLLLTCSSGITANDSTQARFRGTGQADPVRIENVRRQDGPAAGQSTVTFDIAWDHSWRAAWKVTADQHGGTGMLKLESWDAAWVFAKFHKSGAEGYSHATLSTNKGDHKVPAGTKVDIGPSDDGNRGVGLFVYRAKAGSGANNSKDVTLRWLHGVDGVKDPGAVELKVFAIKMVYVPQCAFWVGDGAKNSNPAGRFSAGDTDAPFRIESEDAIVLGGDDRKNLGNHDALGMERAEDFTSSGAQMLPARFPKGFAAFYCMRHEITEGQYVDFLNTLSAKQQDRLDPLKNSPTGIKLVTPGKAGSPAVYQTDRPHVACSGLLWKDCGGYAAWAGLRAMTELEYEKACRGPLKPVPNEYAWGTPGIAGKDFDKLFPDADHAGYVVKNRGRPDEGVAWRGDNAPDAKRGNAVWYGAIRRVGPGGRHGQAAADAVNGPLRAGVFATPRSGRVEAGASYWGILELSGNLWERVMTVGNPYGRRFSGAHGKWPLDKGPQSHGMGTGIRGGTHAYWIAEVTEPPKESRRLHISDREKVSRITPFSREWNGSRSAYWSMGFRCVRTDEIRQPPPAPATVQAAPRPQAPVSDRHSASGGKVIRGVADWLDWNVEIKNLIVKPRDKKTAVLTFDVAWKDSWRDKHNHDAAWLFFKVRAEGGEWQHMRLAADKVLNPTGYGQAKGPTQVDLIVPRGDDGFTGLFLRRSAGGEGPLVAKKVTVVWDLTSHKGNAKDLKGISIRPFGIRMVYVPEGSFHLGSGGLEPGGFYRYSDGSQHIEPYRVTGPGAIQTGRQAGKLWARKHGGQPEDGGAIPAAFPNGFGAFYCMKHQIAPAQYAAFLNMLPKKQADERYAGKERWAVARKNGKVGPGRVHYSGGQGQVFRNDDGYSSKAARARAGPGCFGLSWADGAAFAAWAGLRPMTELELEKAVRGPRKPAPDEVGPSYWGIGGINKWDWDAFKGDPQSERAVTVGNAAGRKFKGTHGLGTLTLPADWPQADAVGSGMRCTHYTPRAGVFDHVWDIQRARLSDRLLAAVADPARCPSHKWRGVRTAPKDATKNKEAK